MVSSSVPSAGIRKRVTPKLFALHEAMGKFVENGFKSGVLVDTNGLKPISEATRVRLSASDLGQCQVGSNPALECAGGGGQGRYTAVFSPHPIRLEHLRE